MTSFIGLSINQSIDQFTIRLHKQNSNQRLKKYAVVYSCSCYTHATIHAQRPTLSQHLVPRDSEFPAVPQISQFSEMAKNFFRR